MILEFVDYFAAGIEKVKKLNQNISYFYIIEISNKRTKIGISSQILQRIKVHNSNCLCYLGESIKKIAIFKSENNIQHLEKEKISLLNNYFHSFQKE